MAIYDDATGRDASEWKVPRATGGIVTCNSTDAAAFLRGDRPREQIVQAVVFAPIVYFLAGFSTSDDGMRFFTFMVLGEMLKHAVLCSLYPIPCTQHYYPKLVLDFCLHNSSQ